MKNSVQLFGLVATFVTSVWVVSCSKNTDSSGESVPTKTDAIQNANQNADQMVQTLLAGLPARVTTQATLEAQVIGAVADLSLRYGLVSGEVDCNKEFKFGSSAPAATGISAPIPSDGYFTLCAELSFSKDATKPPVYGRYVFQRVYPDLKATSLVLSVGEDGEIKGELSASDSAGRSVEYSMVSMPKSGSVSNFDKASGSFVYKPKADYHGSDSFTFLAKIIGSKDVDKGSKSEGRVNISVLSERDHPEAADVAIVVDEDASFEDKISVKNIDSDVLVFEIGEEASNGSAVITSTAEGKFKYTPKKDFFGKDKFSISMGSLSMPEESRKKILVSVDVLPINDQVTASDALVSTGEDTAVEIDLSKYVFDAESDTLSYTLISNPRNGQTPSFDIKTGRLSYLPSKDYNGSDSFKFSVREEGKNLPAALATINIAVENNDNDAPIAEDVLVTVNEDSFDNPIRLVATDSDSSIIYYQIVGFADKRKIDLTNGFLTATQDGTGSVWLYNPTKDKFGVDEIEYVATDGIASSERKKLRITVQNVADNPELTSASFTTNEDTKVALSFTTTNVDNPSDTLTLSVVPGSQPSKGKVEQLNGVWTYTPFANANGDDSWKMVVKNSDNRSSAQVTMSIKIEPVRDLPIARDVKVNGSEDEKISFRLDGTGIDVATITYAQSSKIPANAGNLVQESQGSAKFEFDPAGDFNGIVTFQYTVNDGISDSAPAAVTINLKELNDAPVARNVQVEGKEDQSLTGKFQGTDVDGDSLTYVQTSDMSVEQGTLELVNASTGEFRFTPAKDFFGKVSVEYLVRDASLNSKPATLEINVAPVNDAPITSTSSYSVPLSLMIYENEFASSLVASDIDSDKADLQVVFLGVPESGRISAEGLNWKYIQTRLERPVFERLRFYVKDSQGGQSRVETLYISRDFNRQLQQNSTDYIYNGLRSKEIGSRRTIPIEELNVGFNQANGFSSLGRVSSRPMLLRTDSEIAMVKLNWSRRELEVIQKENVLDGIKCPVDQANCLLGVESVNIEGDWAIATVINQQSVSWSAKQAARFYKIIEGQDGSIRLASIKFNADSLATAWTTRGSYGRSIHVSVGGNIVAIGSAPATLDTSDTSFKVYVFDQKSDQLNQIKNLPNTTSPEYLLKNAVILGVQGTSIYFQILDPALYFVNQTSTMIEELTTNDDGRTWSRSPLFHPKITGCRQTVGAVHKVGSRYYAVDRCSKGSTVVIVENGRLVGQNTQNMMYWESETNLLLKFRGDFVFGVSRYWYLPNLVQSEYP